MKKYLLVMLLASSSVSVFASETLKCTLLNGNVLDGKLIEIKLPVDNSTTTRVLPCGYQGQDGNTTLTLNAAKFGENLGDLSGLYKLSVSITSVTDKTKVAAMHLFSVDGTFRGQLYYFDDMKAEQPKEATFINIKCSK